MTDDWLRKHGGLREYDEATSNWKGFSGKIVGHDGDVELVYDDGTRKLFPAEPKAHAPALTDSVNGEEPSSGLHDVACCASYDFGVDLSEIEDVDQKSEWVKNLKTLNLIRDVTENSSVLKDAEMFIHEYETTGEINFPASASLP